MVGNLQNLDRRQSVHLQHASLRGVFGVSREDHVERTGANVQHHTRVVRLQVARRVAGGPQNGHRRASDSPSITGAQRARRHAERLATSRTTAAVWHIGRTGFRAGPGHAYPSELGHRLQCRCSACVIVMRMRQHEHVHPSQVDARQRLTHRKRVGARINEHSSAGITDEDRVTLAHVQHGDLGTTRGSRSERDGDARSGDKRDQPSRIDNRSRHRPPRPHDRRKTGCAQRQQRPARECDCCTRERCHPRRDPGRHVENDDGEPHEEG